MPRFSAEWVQLITTGRTGRLFLAMLAAPPAGGLAGFLFDVVVVLAMEPETLGDLMGNHGEKPIWFALLTLVLTPAIMGGLLWTHIALAMLRLRAVWPYLLLAGLAGVLFAWRITAALPPCPVESGPCVPPRDATRVLLNNIAMGFVPPLASALAFWLVLRPDRGIRP